MAKLMVSSAAAKGISGTKIIEKMTNSAYHVTSKKADEKIEKNNRMYAATYKKAAQYSAR